MIQSRDGERQNSRWSVSWWAAVATVAATIVSASSLFLSLKALHVSEQQAEDARKYRAEDQKEKAEAKKKAEAAFAERLLVWREGS